MNTATNIPLNKKTAPIFVVILLALGGGFWYAKQHGLINPQAKTGTINSTHFKATEHLNGQVQISGTISRIMPCNGGPYCIVTDDAVIDISAPYGHNNSNQPASHFITGTPAPGSAFTAIVSKTSNDQGSVYGVVINHWYSVLATDPFYFQVN